MEGYRKKEENTPKTPEELKEEYNSKVLEYFKGDSGINDIYDFFEKNLSFDCDKLEGIGKGERVMIIANHPRIGEEFWVKADDIGNLKGGNSLNYEYFHFPAINRYMLEQSFGDVKVVSSDTGWTKAKEDFNSIVIPRKKGGLVKKIIKASGDVEKMVIFPEGACTNMEEFHKGFLYIAAGLGMEKIVTAAFSKELSIANENKLKILSVTDIKNLDPNSFEKFSEERAGEIIARLEKYEQQ